jgi:hypothetical protein
MLKYKKLHIAKALMKKNIVKSGNRRGLEDTLILILRYIYDITKAFDNCRGT